MLISEIYESRQGEGLLTGQMSVFVRTSGCNLRCCFCDTPFTSWEATGDTLSVDTIIAKIEQFESQHVVITGGEPMLAQDITQLTSSLRVSGKHITIETAGTVFKDVDCDLMSISPKLANSTPPLNRAGEWRARHENARCRPELINRLIKQFDYQLKYVVGSLEDVDQVKQHLENLVAWHPDRVLLMPEGVEYEQLLQKQKWLEPVCEQLGYRFCPRKHIEWYGNRRGT